MLLECHTVFAVPLKRLTRPRRESHLDSGLEATVAACLLHLCQGQHQAQSTTLSIAPFYSPQLFPRAQSSDVIQIGRSGSGDYVNANRFVQLYGVSANVAGVPVDEYALPGDYVGVIEEHLAGRDGHDRSRGRLDQVQSRWFSAIILAEGSAYSAYAPLNCSFVAPYTSST